MGNAVPVPALSFDHASFSFGAGAANAVSDVTLELPLGKTLGIIGGTGSGKSTLVSLIPRLHDASAGSVCVMGADVRALGRSTSCAMGRDRTAARVARERHDPQQPNLARRVGNR